MSPESSGRSRAPARRVRSMDGPKVSGPPTLPARFTRFFGREAEIDESRGWRHRPVVTLTGAPGCGKTRHGIELADRLKAGFSTVCMNVGLGRDPKAGDPADGHGQARQVWSAIAWALGIADEVERTDEDTVTELRLLPTTRPGRRIRVVDDRQSRPRQRRPLSTSMPTRPRSRPLRSVEDPQHHRRPRRPPAPRRRCLRGIHPLGGRLGQPLPRHRHLVNSGNCEHKQQVSAVCAHTSSQGT